MSQKPWHGILYPVILKNGILIRATLVWSLPLLRTKARREQRTWIARRKEGTPIPTNAQDVTRGTRAHAVVGIGASAGGLQALEEFFDALPGDTAASFVVVQHLSPDSPSLTPDLLARHTPLRVREAETGMRPEPGEIAFLPPGASVRIEGGILRLRRGEARGPTPTVIDQFFRSLAENLEANAIGIILSGAGSDGSLGLKAIKENGGVTMVQEPGTASFDGMPWSAIRTGAADYVQPPDELAITVSDLVARWRSRPAGEDADAFEAPEDLIARISSIVRSQTGHDFSSYKRGTLTRRLQRRLQLRGTGDLETYAEELRRDPAEAEALFQDLLIGVTQFFRDPEAWATLEEEVVPKLFAGKGAEDSVRVWVPGCATGEEAYSISILLEERASELASPPEIKIFATDLDDHALGFAREGLYPDGIAESVSPERLDRFFRREDDHYRIAKRLRERCIFAPHNLLQDPPFSRLDLVSCRNLLIYLELDSQERAFRVFQYALKAGGYLFLGSSEHITSQRDLFEDVQEGDRIFRRTKVRGTPPTGLLGEVRSARGVRGGFTALPPRRRTEWKEDLRRKVERVLLQSEGPAAVLVNERYEVLHFFGRTRRYVEPSGAGGGADITDMVLPPLRPAVRSALRQARRERRPVTHRDLSVESDGSAELVDVSVRPVTELGSDTDLLLVVLRGRPDPTTPAEDDAEGHGPAVSEPEAVPELEAELRDTRQRLQATIEELENSNEELQSANEELRSMNEELQTAKEEAQSVNEELLTVNAELKKKVSELDEAHSDIHNLFRSTEIATLFLNREQRIQRFTPTSADLFQLRESDVGRPIGHVARRFVDGDLEAEIDRVLDRLTRRQMEVRKPEDGRWFTLRISPYRTVGDVIDGVVLTFTDITDIKETEARLRREREYAQSIVEAVHAPLVVLGADLRLLSASRSFYETFGVSPSAVENARFVDLAEGTWFDAELADVLARTSLRGEPLEGYELEVELADGPRDLLLDARPVLEPGGEETDRVLVTLRDVTERRRREQEREAESRRKDWFLAMLGHEIRNPLAPIQNGVALLQRSGVGEQQRDEILHMMNRQLAYLRRLVDDLLDISRMTSGEIPLHRKRLDLRRLTEEAVGDHRPELEAADLTVTLQLPTGDGAVPLYGDEPRLRQALDNLLSNARKYTPPGGRVSVRLERQPEEAAAILAVADTGIGMDSDTLAHAFDAFHQGPRGPERDEHGLGVGLTLVKIVAEAHGGSVTARSDGAGHGTAIELRLPVGEPSATTEAEEGAPTEEEAEPSRRMGDAPTVGEASPPSSAGMELRVLIVEDQRDMAETTRLLLEHEGYQVAVAPDGEKALQALREGRPDIVLCDLGLPGSMNGYDLARAVRADDELRSTRLVALTGYGQDSDRERGRETGFDAYLVKPVAVEELKAALSVEVRSAE